VTLPRLEGASERLDEPHHEIGTLERSLDHVAAVNRWFGGRRALLHHLSHHVSTGPVAILDVGTGSADLPLAITRWARRHGRAATITAVDVHPQIAGVASRRTTGEAAVRVAVADGLHLPFPEGAFDVALLSLTLHHFDGAGQLRILTELARVVRCRIIVGELHRTRLSYLGARLLAGTVWRADPLTRHDGPMSVLRAFRPEELQTLATKAGLRDVVVQRHPLFRLVLTARPARKAR
jgi:SAM-dependent methyltransferase